MGDAPHRQESEEHWKYRLPEILKKKKSIIERSNSRFKEKVIEFYPGWEHPLNLNLLHSTEFIMDLIKNGKIHPKKELSKKLTYHDPCELARHTTPTVRRNYNTSDIYEAPREIISEIPETKLEEMRYNREKHFVVEENLESEQYTRKYPAK